MLISLITSDFHRKHKEFIPLPPLPVSAKRAADRAEEDNGKTSFPALGNALTPEEFSCKKREKPRGFRGPL
jgi:hypothetical protein